MKCIYIIIMSVSISIDCLFEAIVYLYKYKCDWYFQYLHHIITWKYRKIHEIKLVSIKMKKHRKSCWHTVYSYGKIVNVAERAAEKYNIRFDFDSEKNEKTSWHERLDVIIYKSCWRRTIRTIEIRSERKVKKFLTDQIRNDMI